MTKVDDLAEAIKSAQALPNIPAKGVKRFSDFASKAPLRGEKYKLNELLGKEIVVMNFRTKATQYPERSGDLVIIQFVFPDDPDKVYVTFSGSEVLKRGLIEYKDNLPFLTTIIKVKNYLTFS
ncbi:MAG: hypothetical protein LBR82_00315 [Desulfovibrio sp.]|nr:hypothetical protein [Desulfovibrio sp.]